MRWIVGLVILAIGVWYVSNRRRRDQLQQTWQDTVPSSVTTQAQQAATTLRDTVQNELADIGEKVDSLRAQAQAPAEPAEKSAGGAFGAGTLNTTEMKTATTPGATGADRAGEDSTAQGPRPIAGEGTTTVMGEAVQPLSPRPDGSTSTGQAETLPPGLAAGEPGTGGPAGSSQAPSTGDSTETPTTGMEHAPEIDRAEEVLKRTSGDFIGNKNTRVFHAATSSNLPDEENRVYFESEEEALAAGFRPAEREGLESASS